MNEDISDKSSIKVDVGIGAKAEVKTEIPSRSMGRALDAVVDMFRPYTEARGLRADHIRLQREDVLIEIAKRSKQRLAIEGIEPATLPNKFLIQFIEKASHEAIDNEMLVNAWASLLATSSRGNLANQLMFLDILSRTDSIHLQLLDDICTGRLGFFQDAPWDTTRFYFNKEIDRLAKQFGGIGYVTGVYERLKESVFEVITEKFDRNGARILYCAYDQTAEDGKVSTFELDDEFLLDERIFPQGIHRALQSLGLIEILEIGSYESSYFHQTNQNFFVKCLVVTHLGAEFYEACHGELNAN